MPNRISIYSIMTWLLLGLYMPLLAGQSTPVVSRSIDTAVSGVDSASANVPATATAQPSAGVAQLSPDAQYKVFIPLVTRPSEAGWPMAGANPARTSWVAEEVRGSLRVAWYRPIEPFIAPRVQIIAMYNTLYVSTAKGLYALSTDTGELRWVYSTEMPLGNSPTIYNGVAYVGGFDNKLHAIDAFTGQGLWTFTAGAGFDTNPLVINGVIYLGGRDGYMYAVYGQDSSKRGQLAWKYKTAGPIHFSAAYQEGKIFFASDDSYAYALDSITGALVWKSPKLPTGDGFHSWWPVIDGNLLILSSSKGYRLFDPPQTDWSAWVLTKGDDGYDTPMGPWLADGTMDATQAMQYLESKPWRRTYFVLDLATGQEITYDFDRDGKPEYAPLLNAGTNSGTRYPAVVGPDGTIYTFNVFASAKYGQGVAGWKPGTSIITTPSGVTAADEPLGYSAAGNVIYYTQCCDRSGGAFAMDGSAKWPYYSYNLDTLAPGYDVQYMGTEESRAVAVYGGWNGIYGSHGDQNPPIPYSGKVFVHRSNAIIAFAPQGQAKSLPILKTVTKTDPVTTVDVNQLKQKLADEIQKIIDAGHLRPGYGALGGFAGSARGLIGDNFADYWSNPADTILMLTRAYPYLSSTLQQSLKTYLQSEFNNYSPCSYTHVGWSTGAAREAFTLPPEVTSDMPNWRPTMWSTHNFEGWTGPDEKWTPHTFYALWKYAQAFGNAKAIFDSCKDRLWTPPSDAILAEYPFAHNAWIAGYTGYLELQKLAGYAEDSTKRATLNRLLSLRATNFAKDNPWGPDAHNDGQILSVARNFIFMTPELGDYLRSNALSKVQAAYSEYANIAPYWFVTKFEATFNEGVMQPLYDYNGLFAARAMIFRDSREELAKYLDVPAFARGDLFYIQNLILTIESASALPTSTPLADEPSEAEPSGN